MYVSCQAVVSLTSGFLRGDPSSSRPLRGPADGYVGSGRHLKTREVALNAHRSAKVLDRQLEDEFEGSCFHSVRVPGKDPNFQAKVNDQPVRKEVLLNN